MSNKMGHLVLTVLLAGLFVPMSTFAYHDTDRDDYKTPAHSVAYWERYFAHELASYQKDDARQHARLERERRRIEARLAENRKDLCRDIARVKKRYSVNLTVPDFCTENVAPAVTFSADPSSVMKGASSTLTWTSSNATLCVASGGWSGEKTLSGTLDVSPNATTMYTLSCGNGTATATASVQVNVTPEPVLPPLVTLSVASTTIQQGSSTLMSWTSTNATACVAKNGWNGARTTSGTESVSPNATTTYTLECGNGNASGSASVIVNVVVPSLPAPTLSFSADPPSVTKGASSTLTWTSSNATLCVASGGWTGTKTQSGSQDVAPNATTTYTLACGGVNGTTTKSVEVGVTATPPPLTPSVTLGASPLTVTVGGTSTLTWTSTNATHCEASGGAGWSGVKVTNGTQEVTVSATTTYTLACGNGTATATESVQVNALPIVVPVSGKVVLSEVMYDLDATHGTEGDNEWIEIYNGTGAPVNLAGWKLRDGNATDTIATTSPLILPVGGYAVVVATGTTAGFWGGFSSAALVINLNSANGIGNGLADSGDVLRLFDADSIEKDAVSWGGNTTAFNPSVPTAPAGSSIARVPVTTDTDTKNDWVVLTNPTPGA